MVIPFICIPIAEFNYMISYLQPTVCNGGGNGRIHNQHGAGEHVVADLG